MVGSAAATKARIRDEMRSRRESLDRGAVAAASELVTGLLCSLSAVVCADSVASYRSIRGEINLAKLAESGLRAEFSFPRVNGRELEFVGECEGQSFATGAFGIQEPTSGLLVALADHDVVLVPLTAFDANCHRVGQGGGFYDRALTAARPRTAPRKPAEPAESRESRHRPGPAGAPGAVRRPVAMGIAYDFQQIDEVPVEPWDVPLDAVVTDSGLIAADPAAPWWRTPVEQRPARPDPASGPAALDRTPEWVE